jgi:DNA-binding protein H-NS
MPNPKYTPEQEAALRSIGRMMEFWGITPAEVKRAPSPPAKYRHPRTGQEWSGIGRQPQWLRDALLTEGFTVDELKPDRARVRAT